MSLYKLFLLGIAVFYNTACDGYYENDKNPFKVSGQCDNDIYNYSKQDLADEAFGKIGVASNIKEYPRAGVSKVFTHNDGRMLSIQGRFASLCKSSIINKVKIELHNNHRQVKTYYPSISNGYYGDILLEIDINKDQENRCFFNETAMIFKTWARDEDGNTYYAHKYSKSPNFNVTSKIDWGAKYSYRYRNQYENTSIITSTKYETEYKDEDREVLGKSYIYTYKYRYRYTYKYKYGDKYKYKYPVEMAIYGDNDYPGKYFEMFINISDLGIEKRYKISNEKRKVDFILYGNSKMRAGDIYTLQVSFAEQLNNCNIESKLKTKTIRIPNESVDSIEYHKLISTEKILTYTSKVYQYRVRKDSI